MQRLLGLLLHSTLCEAGQSTTTLPTPSNVESLCAASADIWLLCVWCRFWSPNAPASFVMHMYANSWKKDHFKVADQKKAQRKAEQWPARLKRRLHQVAPLLLLTGGVLLAAAVVKWRRSGLLAATVLPLMVDMLGGERQALLPERGDKHV